MKYSERLTKSKDQKKLENQSMCVKKAQHGLESTALGTEEKLIAAKEALELAKDRFPLDVQKIFDLEDEVIGLEEALLRIEKLKKELF